MIWLTWRQHRIEILIMGVLLLFIAIFLLVTGLHIATESQHIVLCKQQHGEDGCLAEQVELTNSINRIVENVAVLVLGNVLPVLAGMFIGASVVARELEQGTYRMIWTQGIPWQRWLSGKIGLLACTVLCAFSLLFGLLSWWGNLSVAAGGGNVHLDFSSRFDAWGTVAIAYALFAFILGICAGVILRKTVPAIAVTLVIFIVVRVLIVNFWRPYYLPPMSETGPAGVGWNVPGDAWIVSVETLNREGQVIPNMSTIVCYSQPGSGDPTQCLKDHGFQYRVLYQPAERFWIFQGIESGIYLLLTALLLALIFWWTSYRIVGK
jgi:ABC-type transport system involved in multi-copper enzyme maturation permease subunit